MISVIVPVYNTQKYIVRCLECLTKQTLKDIEVIMIDDGSTDESGEICDKYAGKYNNFKVFHKQNGGVSTARNLGIKNVSGKYIFFLDSDDWIEPDYLFKL